MSKNTPTNFRPNVNLPTVAQLNRRAADAEALAQSQHIVTVAAKAEAFDRIAEILFPVAEPGIQWGHDHIELVAERVLAIYPGAAEGDRTLAKE